jgi:hypothetical protein
MALAGQLFGQVGPDKAGPAGDEDFHGRILTYFIKKDIK